MHLFRKHQKALLWIMFVGIGIPMLFFGVPTDCYGPGGMMTDVEVAEVDGVPIMASEFRRSLSDAARRQAQGGDVPTFKELEAKGVASEVFQQLQTSSLITSLESKRNFNLEQSFLEDRLKEDPTFQDDDGNFNGARFNAWVTARQGMDWEAVYESIGEQVSRQVYMTTRLASANRVLDKDVQQELVDSATKIQMEYLKVEPPVEPTEAQITTQYEANKETVYRKPPTYTADYVAFSLVPTGPSEKVGEVLTRAQAGEDFAVLADEVSDLGTKNGGELGWLSERETELDYRKPLFTLAVGAVSEPVKGPGGYYIYKVEEERTNEESQKREILARHIYIKVELSEEDRAAVEAKAEALAASLREQVPAPADTEGVVPAEDVTLLAGNLIRAAAPDAVATATGFSVETTDIEGIPTIDAFQFRRVVDEEAKRGASPEFPVIAGKDNLYVAQVIAQEEGAIPPLSDVREQVIDDARAAEKGTDAYKEKTAELAKSIVAQATSLDDVKTKFPELNVAIKETRPFTKKEYLFQDQIYLQTTEIYDALEGKGENEIAGPLTDFLGGTYFIALTNREEPAEEAKENWDEEGKELRERLLATARYELTEDYTADLQERFLPNMITAFDQEVYQAVVGLDDDADDAAAVDMPEGGDSAEVDGDVATESAPEENAPVTTSEASEADGALSTEAPAEEAPAAP